jgi:hypothetical protein
LLHSPFDLHVLGTPPAFILSQDQTLRKNFYRLFRRIRYSLRLYKTTGFRLPITFQLLRYCTSALRGLSPFRDKTADVFRFYSWSTSASHWSKLSGTDLQDWALFHCYRSAFMRDLLRIGRTKYYQFFKVLSRFLLPWFSKNCLVSQQNCLSIFTGLGLRPA